MVSQGKGQPIRVPDDQIAMMTNVLKVISQLVSTLQASIIDTQDHYTNNYYTNNNMRRHVKEDNISNTPGNTRIKATIPRVQAPSPTRISRVDAGPTPDSTKQKHR